MKITIKTSFTKSIEKSLILPLFWKEPDGGNYIAAINDDTCVKFYISRDGQYISLQHGTCSFLNSEIAQADANWIPIDESEFLRVYDDAHESIRLKPMMIDTGRNEAYAEYQKENNL